MLQTWFFRFGGGNADAVNAAATVRFGLDVAFRKRVGGGFPTALLLLFAAECAFAQDYGGQGLQGQRAPGLAERQATLDRYRNLPLAFEENLGQTVRRVDFIARGPGYQVFLAPGEMTIKVVSKAGFSQRSGVASGGMGAIRLRWRGTRNAARGSGSSELPGRVNYLGGGDSGSHLSGIATYARVGYQDVYPGIDLVYYGKQRQLEYDLVVGPRGDPRRIRFSVEGAEHEQIDRRGDLLLRTATETLRLHRPIVYQMAEGRRKYVSGRYFRSGKDRFGIAVGAYDRSVPLVIDPVLSYGTFLGGTGDDTPNAIAVDASGSVYVAGSTQSPDYPLVGAYDRSISARRGDQDGFVTKVNASGSALVYSTYLGNKGGRESIEGIAVDASGGAYVVGYTSGSDFPVTAGAYRTGVYGGSAFVTKLSPTGSTLAYSTYLPGADARGVAVDAAGNAYVTGKAGTSFATTPGAFQTVMRSTGSTPYGSPGNAYIASLNAAGTAMNYSTFIGGTGVDSGRAVAVDDAGYAYVAGWTTSADFPVAGAYQTVLRGQIDGFVAKMNPAGNALVYSTYFGGSLDDRVNALAIGTDGSAYLAGETYSSDFPVKNAFQPRKSGVNLWYSSLGNAFVSKLLPQGDAIGYSSFLGGEVCTGPCETPGPTAQVEGDIGQGIAVDAAGHAFVSGFAATPFFPLLNSLIPNQGASLQRQGSSFLAKVGMAGNALMYATLTGTGAYNSGTGAFTYRGPSVAPVSIDAHGEAYGAGRAEYPEDIYLITPGAYQTTLAGDYGTGTVFKLSSPSLPMTLVSAGNPVAAGVPFTLTAEIADPELAGTVAFFDGSSLIGTAPLRRGVASLTVALAAGIHRLTAAHRAGATASDTAMLYQVVNPAHACR